MLFLLPFSGYCQEISITQSQKIDLKLSPAAASQESKNGKARGLLIVGAVVSAAGVGIGLSGPVTRPNADRIYRQIGAGVFAVGAGFTISGISKLK